MITVIGIGRLLRSDFKDPNLLNMKVGYNSNIIRGLPGGVFLILILTKMWSNGKGRRIRIG